MCKSNTRLTRSGNTRSGWGDRISSDTMGGGISYDMSRIRPGTFRHERHWPHVIAKRQAVMGVTAVAAGGATVANGRRLLTAVCRVTEV